MSTKTNTKDVKKSTKTEDTLVVSQELFDLNEFLAEEGVEVGMEIELTKELKAKLVMPEPKPEPKVGAVGPKVSCPVAILAGEEYIRTYEKGQEDSAAEFLAKNPNMKGVDPEDIASITVSYRETEKKKDDSGRETDTGRMLTRAVKFSEATNGKDWLAQARKKASEGVRRSCTVSMA